MNKIQTLNREKCIICQGKLRTVQEIKNFPVFMGTTEASKDLDLFSDMIFSTCTSCHSAQMKSLIPLEILYKNGHNNSVGKIWERHHLEFSKFINKTASGDIVEIGGASLSLAKHLEKNENINSITVFDTNLSYYQAEKTEKINLKEKFFDENSISKKPNAIIHSHVIEHLYNPMKEIFEMSNILDDGGHMFISAPLVDVMLKDYYTNAMNFEHTYDLTENMLEYILRHANLRITEKKYFNKHCIFVAAVKDSSINKSIEFVSDDSHIYEFFKHYERQIAQINSKLEPETYVFGAHIFTQFLLKFGLKEEMLTCVLDNDVKKQKQRLYGTNLIVSSPKILKFKKEPLVLLKAGQYTEEIKKDILENINSKTRFIL